MTLTAIGEQADAAARRFVESGGFQGHRENPYPIGSDAAAVYKSSFERFLVLHSAPAEGGA